MTGFRRSGRSGRTSRMRSSSSDSLESSATIRSGFSRGEASNEYVKLLEALRKAGGGAGQTKSGITFVVLGEKAGPEGTARFDNGTEVTEVRYQTLAAEGREYL